MNGNEGKHILVIEDEDHLRNIIRFNLEAEGYRVTAVVDGPSGLAVLENDPLAVDLVLLDLMLPGMSGYAVCEAMRQSGHDLPVLIVSARTLAEDRTRGFDVGADQYLQKPFELEELFSRVRNLLRRHATLLPIDRGPGAVYEFGNSRVNFDTFEVTVDGEPQKLTALDMKLLRYFIEHEGKVVSRQELLTHVWQQPGTLSTRTVDNFIVRLRRAFEEDPAHPRHFLSLRGAGYRFVASGDSGEAAADLAE